MKQPHYLENWLRNACRQLTEPGVHLEFVSESGALADRPHETQDVLPSEVVWQREFRLSGERQGALRIRVDHSVALHDSFMKLCHFGEHLAHIAESQEGEEEPGGKLSLVDNAGRGASPIDRTGQQLIDQSLAAIVEMTSYRGAAFFLLDGQGSHLKLKGYIHRSLEPVLRTDRPVSRSPIDQQALDRGLAICRSEESGMAEWLPVGVATGICFTVKLSSGPIGTLWVYDRRRRGLHDRDFHVAQSIATRLSKSLEDHLLHHQSIRHRRLKAELRLAAVTQPASLLKYNNPSMQIEVHGCCMSRYELGGDLCEICPLPDDRLFVAIGDASGNSLPAAMVMTAVRGAIYALLERFRTEKLRNFEPAEFVRDLNAMLTRITEANQFMSFICGIFDLSRRTFTYCNAGHPQPIHLRDNQLEYLRSSGLLMGIDSEVRYSQELIELRRGDVLILYTDGISEALSASNHLFRQDGIAAAALPHASRSAQRIFEAIWAGMNSHLDHDQKTDDATALVVKV